MTDRGSDGEFAAWGIDQVTVRCSRLMDRDFVAEDVVEQLARLIPAGETFVLVDEKYLSIDPLLPARKCCRFAHGWTGPGTEAAIVGQFERFRREGAGFIVFAWPALWWLDHYTALSARLQVISERVHAGDGYVAFDLRPGPRAQKEAELATLRRSQQATTEARAQDAQRLVAAKQALAALSQEVRSLKDSKRSNGNEQAELAVLKRTLADHERARARNAAEVTTAKQVIANLAQDIQSLKKDLARSRAHVAYLEQLSRIRGITGRVLPQDATLLVVSGGDDTLLELGHRRGQHFPQMPDGVHGGTSASSAGAIEHLEQLRARGGTHLLLPEWATWWLEFFDGFHAHLEATYRLVWNDASCVIYDLRTSHDLRPQSSRGTHVG